MNLWLLIPEKKYRKLCGLNQIVNFIYENQELKRIRKLFGIY